MARMPQIQKIMVCPNCYADCSSVSPYDIEHNKCPFCGAEIYDHSKYLQQMRIDEVEAQRLAMKKVPVRVALLVISILVLLMGGTIAYYVLHVDKTVATYQMTKPGTDYTRKMEKCYKAKDWDGLYDIVITDCEKALNSPYYFTYRSAWFLSTFPQAFDDAYASGDRERMEEIYSIMREDYNLRQNETNRRLYEWVDEIEEALVVEYERETEMMDEE